MPTSPYLRNVRELGTRLEENTIRISGYYGGNKYIERINQSVSEQGFNGRYGPIQNLTDLYIYLQTVDIHKNKDRNIVNYAFDIDEMLQEVVV
jgi:hypothetical protein